MENDPRLNPGGDGETISVSDARGAKKTVTMRWVMIITTVIAFAALAMVGFMMRP